MSSNYHPSDEDLILRFYDECDADDVRRIDEHLRDCASCRAMWTELGETMEMVDRAAMPEPGPGFERVMWARVQPALPAAPAPSRSPWTIRLLLPMAATILVSALTGGYLWRALHRVPVTAEAPMAMKTPAAAPGVAPAAGSHDTALGERVLLTALDDHFQQAQMLLVELKNAPDDDTDFDFERATADDLVTAGRLYRLAARQHGERQFAQMLDDLESVLLDVARSPDKVDADDLRLLRARIDSQDLLFKVRAAAKQVHERQRDLLTSANE